MRRGTKFSVRIRVPIIALARAMASGDMPPSTSGSVSTTRSRSFWLVIRSMSPIGGLLPYYLLFFQARHFRVVQPQ